MFYLLSKQQKEKIKTEYWVKVANLFSVSMFIIILSSVCLAAPTVIRMYTELSTLNAVVEPLQREISDSKLAVAKEGVNKILADVDILNMPARGDISKIYTRFIEVVESVPGVKVQSITVDTISKTIQTELYVKDKNVAQNLVKRFEDEKYDGASLSYGVLSNKGSFTFAQKLSYENN